MGPLARLLRSHAGRAGGCTRAAPGRGRQIRFRTRGQSVGGSDPRRKTLDRTIYPAVPPHVEYALTSLGQSAALPLNALRSWVEENIDHASRPEPVMS